MTVDQHSLVMLAAMQSLAATLVVVVEDSAPEAVAMAAAVAAVIKDAMAY